MRKSWLNLFVCFLVVILMAGCASTQRTSSQSSSGSNPIKTYYHDSNIQFAIIQRLRKAPSLKRNTHIVSAVYHQVVLLAGQVVNPGQRIKAEQLVKSIPGVRRVYNEITIAGSITTLTRSSDAWLTSKVKSALAFTKGIPSRYIKVVTENGVVYLMGRLPRTQARQAAKIASQVQGVQKVVTLFEVIN